MIVGTTCYSPVVTFEQHFASGDQEQIDEQFLNQPMNVVARFKDYVRPLMLGEGPLDPEHGSVLARLRVIADTVARLFHAKGLQKEVVALATFDSHRKKIWIQEEANYRRAFRGYYRGSYRECLDGMQRAEKAFTELGLISRIPDALHYQGCCYSNLGQYEEAIESFRRAALGFDDVYEVADTHSRTCLARCQVLIGQYESALTILEKARAINQQRGIAMEVAFAEREMGYCYTALGQFEKSISWLESALQGWRATGQNIEIANCLDRLAMAYSSAGQPQKAVPLLEEALARQRNAVTGADRAMTHNLLGNALCQLNRPEEAIAAHGDALVQLEKLTQPIHMASALNGLGTSHAALGHFEQAQEYHQHALDLLTSVQQHRDAAWTLKHLAECQLATGHHADALASLEQCMDQLGHVGRRILPDDGRSAFLSQWAEVPVTTSAAVTGLDANDAAAMRRGLPIIDSFAARTLIEGLQERAEAALLPPNPQLIAEREHTLNEMEELRLALAHVASSDSDVPALKSRLTQAEQRLEQLDQQWRTSNPVLKQLVSPAPASLDSLQRTVLRPMDALLIFVLGSKTSFVWIITDTDASVLQLAPADRLREEYERLVSSLDPMRADDQSFVAPARALYRLLLVDAEPLLKGRTNLIIVPDGFLSFVPFDVLLTRDVDVGTSPDPARLPYLVREKSVRYAPSASSLIWLNQQGSAVAAKKTDILLLGDPVYGVEDQPSPEIAMRSVAALRPGRVRRLLATRKEVIGIAQSLVMPQEHELTVALEQNLPRSGELHGARFDLYVGKPASKARLESDLERYRLLHLAVHGYVDTEWPWFSGLVLSGPGEESYSFLNLIDIASLDLDADLVFLSACETARGQVMKGEGIKNTVRSFLLAGARSVVATQWTVNDEASAVLARSFYAKLFAGASPAESLRLAKLELISHSGSATSLAARSIETTEPERASSRFNHPTFWAPFVAWGSR